MDKILELLKQISSDDELAEGIVSEMKSWRKIEEDRLMSEYRGRLERAKEICVEETESYKREVSRKVEIFLESQVNAVERGARKRLAIEDTEATNQLKQVRAMLDGVKFDGTTEDLQAVTAENDKLRKQLVVTSEERDTVKTQWKQVHDIAQKTLKRNQVLESKNSGNRKAIAESKGKKKGSKLEKSRKRGSKPQSTRPTLTESQTRKPVKPNSNSNQNSNSSISEIAKNISEIA